MHPFLFGDISSYSVMILLGLLVALLLLRLFSQKFNLSENAFTTHILFILVSIIVGFFSAYLFQAFYNWWGTGDFEFGGITFMGGLVGGTLTFVLLSAVFTKGEEKKSLWNTVNLSAICIPAAHAFGRMGCFLAGCCHGKETSSWLGMDFGDGVEVVPTQLIESIFLTLLCVALIVLAFKFHRRGIIMITYLYSYAIFRFILEFFRGDYRGGAGFFSPSQWQSILMVLAATALTLYLFYFGRVPYNGKQSGRLSDFLFVPKENPSKKTKENTTKQEENTTGDKENS